MKISASVFRSLGEIIATKFSLFFQEHGKDFDEESLKAFLDRFSSQVEVFLAGEHYNLCDDEDFSFQIHDPNC